MHTWTRIILAAVLPLLVTSAAAAQEARFSAAVKAGISAENSEDGLTGSAPALGVTASAAVSPNWRAEAEFWLPGYLKDSNGDPKHRDILVSVSAVRVFRAGRARPFVVAGLSFTQTQDWFTFCTADRVLDPGTPPVRALVSCDEPDIIERRRERNDGRDGYLLLGSGVEVPLGSRLRIVADVRLSLAPVSVIVRPGVGLVIGF